VDLKAMDAGETEAWISGLGVSAYRSRQIRQWLFQKLSASFQDMTNLPKSFRTMLEESALIDPIDLIKTEESRDGTRKYLFRLKDGHTIESVLIPERDHATLCISSQAGCAMNCVFCLTGKQGLKRDLSPSEIIEQIILVRRTMNHPDKLTNIVFMGMGEPLANYDAVLRALKNIISEEGMNFSHRKVTLSTCGLIPQIKKLGQDITVNLAVSLNAADDETRSRLMPVNRTYPLDRLISACRDFPLPNRRMITFEYILVKGVNDGDDDAYRVAGLLSGIRAKINLISLNPHPRLNLTPPSSERVLRFQDILVNRQFTAIIRKSKGRDISAACGQLSGKG
jgi:23S rRNA (adenine2503-C2)-methyltransferase